MLPWDTLIGIFISILILTSCSLRRAVTQVIPSTGQRYLIFRQAGNQGSEWHHANILINSPDNYTIEFEARKGRARSPTIAIDSVHFTQDCYQPKSK